MRTPEVELAIHSPHPQCTMTGFVSVQRNVVRMHVMFRRLAAECFRSRLATRSTQIKLRRVALTINGTIQIRELATNLNWIGYRTQAASSHEGQR